MLGRDGIHTHTRQLLEAKERIRELEAAGRLTIEAWRRNGSVNWDLTEALVRLDAIVRQVEEQ